MSPEALAEVSTAIGHLEALRDGTLRPGTPGGVVTPFQQLAALQRASDCIEQAKAIARAEAGA